MLFAASPPPCFGNGQYYDNETLRCRQCQYQHPCRQEVIRMSFTPQYVPPAVTAPPSYYPGAPAPAPAPVPAPYNPGAFQVPVQVAPPPAQWRPPAPTWPAPAPTAWTPAPPRVPVQPVQFAATAPPATPPSSPNYMGTYQIPAGMPYSPLGYYGYAPDPMFQMLAAVPPMWRPQQLGESFGSRVMKNMALVLLEETFSQLMLATRQAFLPPPPPRAQEAVIDVTPRPSA